ncbi:hypothetical protein C2G38_2186224 [Gigaspora rosea]|uniref:Uncharacterized protein n=1 Tax=Gigaspora rosea TaxID=44941 RepID=A0A397V5X3_9GLOM|nr:hypothetical protein C2G38_2186224 [Gigaspora rosea]
MSRKIFVIRTDSEGHRDNSVIASGTEARVIPAIKNTLVRLENNLPDDLMANLLLILTKCNKGGSCFSIDTSTKGIAKPKKVFYMDNQAFCIILVFGKMKKMKEN